MINNCYQHRSSILLLLLLSLLLFSNIVAAVIVIIIIIAINPVIKNYSHFWTFFVTKENEIS